MRVQDERREAGRRLPSKLAEIRSEALTSVVGAAEQKCLVAAMVRQVCPDRPGCQGIGDWGSGSPIRGGAAVERTNRRARGAPGTPTLWRCDKAIQDGQR